MLSFPIATNRKANFYFWLSLLNSLGRNSNVLSKDNKFNYLKKASWVFPACPTEDYSFTLYSTVFEFTVELKV